MKHFKNLLMIVAAGVFVAVCMVNFKIGLVDYGKRNSSSMLTLEALTSGETGSSEQSSGHTPGEWVQVGNPEEEIVKLGGECIRKIMKTQEFQCSSTGTSAYYCGTYREITDYIPVEIPNC